MISTRRLPAFLTALSLLLAVQGCASLDKRASVSATLPHTDGTTLPPKPAPLPQAQLDSLMQSAKRACDTGCITPFGTPLGAVDGVTAYSNCQAACVHPAYSFLNLDDGQVSVHTQNPEQDRLRFVGLTYQCVEYARRWWMVHAGMSFGSVDGASDVLYLTEGTDLLTGRTFALGRSINGSAKRPPRRGDLLVYAAIPDNPKWRWGHVAVVTEVDLQQGVVSLAEQNITNAAWLKPDAWARQVRLFEVGGRYTVIDVSPASAGNPDGAAISGWVYPLQGP